jgi:hypothetical protein
MKEFLNLLQRYWVGKAGPIPLPGRSCEFTLLDIFWSNVTEHIYIQPFGRLLKKRHSNWTSIETCSLLGLYAALSGDSIPTFCDNHLVLSSRVKMSKKNMSW